MRPRCRSVAAGGGGPPSDDRRGDAGEPVPADRPAGAGGRFAGRRPAGERPRAPEGGARHGPVSPSRCRRHAWRGSAEPRHCDRAASATSRPRCRVSSTPLAALSGR
ncbi:hypothetical protein CA984_38800 [Streptosporangium minutum]|uniref:Uncharacterized protein n=1 Tax=Streptosporangium minutum TaxID=569862 RepID=A0A243QVE8_9ACTN|nr:hypothetical protein CA984_38800 [Streptosporangium minutum]